MDRLPALTAEHLYRATRSCRMGGTTICWDTAAPGAAAVNEPCTPTPAGTGRVPPAHPCSCTSPSKSSIPGQGQTHTAHWLRFSTYNSALFLTLPLEKMTISSKIQVFLSKCDFCFQNPGRKLETIH